MTAFEHDSAAEGIRARDLFKIRETRCWPCLGSGRIGRYGRRVCPNCDGTGRDQTLVLAFGPPRPDESSRSH